MIYFWIIGYSEGFFFGRGGSLQHHLIEYLHMAFHATSDLEVVIIKKNDENPARTWSVSRRLLMFREVET